MDENVKELYIYVCKKEKEYSNYLEKVKNESPGMIFGNWRAYYNVKTLMENIFVIDSEVI